MILDLEKSLEDGAIRPWQRKNEGENDGYYSQVLQSVCRQFAIPYRVAVKELSLKQREIILYGPPKKEKVQMEYKTGSGQIHHYETGFGGVIPNLQRRYAETSSKSFTSSYKSL